MYTLTLTDEVVKALAVAIEDGVKHNKELIKSRAISGCDDMATITEAVNNVNNLSGVQMQLMMQGFQVETSATEE